MDCYSFSFWARIEAWGNMSGFGDCLARWVRASSAIEKPISTRKSAYLRGVEAIKE